MIKKANHYNYISCSLKTHELENFELLAGRFGTTKAMLLRVLVQLVLEDADINNLLTSKLREKNSTNHKEE